MAGCDSDVWVRSDRYLFPGVIQGQSGSSNNGIVSPASLESSLMVAKTLMTGGLLMADGCT